MAQLNLRVEIAHSSTTVTLEEYGEPHKTLTFWRNMVDLTKRSYTIVAVVLVVLVTVAILTMSVATVICTKRLCR